MRLFCGSDIEIPLILWSEKTDPPVSIKPLDVEDDKVRKILTQSHVYEFENYGGCWCPFIPDSNGFVSRWIQRRWPEKPEYAHRRRDTRENLARILDGPARRGSCNLWACVVGEEGSPPRTTRRLNCNEFLVDDSRFVAGELVRFVVDQSAI